MERPIEPSDDGTNEGLSRRELLKRFGIAGAALAAGPAFLAACGDDKKDTSTSGTTAAGGTTSGGDVGSKLARMLNVDAATAGKDLSISVGAVLALSGTGSFYGKTMSRGLDLAAKHITA